MAQHVWARVSSRSRRRCPDYLPHTLPRYRFRPARNEKQWRTLPSRQRWPTLTQINRERVLRRASDGNNAFFVALTPNQYITHIKLHIFEFQCDDFRYAERASIKHFEHCAIAKCQSHAISRTGVDARSYTSRCSACASYDLLHFFQRQ